MSSKKSLKKKLRHQNTKHRLEMSDLIVKLEATTYNLQFADAQVKTLASQLSDIENALTSNGFYFDGKDIVILTPLSTKPVVEEKDFLDLPKTIN